MKDHNGYKVITHEMTVDQARQAETYNRKHGALAMARIAKSHKQGQKPSEKDVAIAYNLN